MSNRSKKVIIKYNSFKLVTKQNMISNELLRGKVKLSSSNYLYFLSLNKKSYAYILRFIIFNFCSIQYLNMIIITHNN